MTMFDHFPSYYYYYSDQNLYKLHFDGLGHGHAGLMSQLQPQGLSQSYHFCYFNNADSDSYCLLGNNRLMAEDESRTESVNDEAASSYSKDIVLTATTTGTNFSDHPRDDHDGWLQLSIGGGSGVTTPAVARHNNNNNVPNEDRSGGGRLGLVELDLLPPGPSCGQARPPPPYSVVEFRPPLAPPPTPPLTHFTLPQPLTNSVATPGAVGFISATSPSYLLQPQPGTPDINWAIRPVMAVPSSSSSPPFMYAPPHSSSRFTPRPPAFPLLYAGVGGVAGGAAPSLDFRVIDPPRRPHSGIWFSLQASQNQAKEPFLPQIPKSYLRIKDGGMTIRLVLKYLVNKLQLENESEIEIRCRGQELPPSLTLQHVRDEIWMSNNEHGDHTLTLLPNPSTSATNHVMVLLYGRKSSSA